LNTSYSAEHIFSLCYPSDAILKKDTQLPIFEDFLQRFTISREPKKVEAKVEKIAQDAIESNLAHVEITFDKNTCTAKVRLVVYSLFKTVKLSNYCRLV
jgi:hypothetical protein